MADDPIGPAWGGDPEARERALDAARNKPPTGTPPQRRFVGFEVPGAPPILRDLVGQLLAQEHFSRGLAARFKALDAARDAGEPVAAVAAVRRWYEFPTATELLDLELELIAAPPVGSDLRGVWPAWLGWMGHPQFDRPGAGGAEVHGVVIATHLEGATDWLDQLEELRRLLAAAPAWPAEGAL